MIEKTVFFQSGQFQAKCPECCWWGGWWLTESRALADLILHQMGQHAGQGEILPQDFEARCRILERENQALRSDCLSGIRANQILRKRLAEAETLLRMAKRILDGIGAGHVLRMGDQPWRFQP